MKKQAAALETNIKELGNMIDKSSDSVKAESHTQVAGGCNYFYGVKVLFVA